MDLEWDDIVRIILVRSNKVLDIRWNMIFEKKYVKSSYQHSWFLKFRIPFHQLLQAQRLSHVGFSCA
jgi:hypothetical protein